jgi:SAM-dependent methyltransferase
LEGEGRVWREAPPCSPRDPRLITYAANLLRDTVEPLIVDIGCGTGSTYRALQPLLSPDARWRLVDRDEELLAEAVRRCGERVEAVVFDLAAMRPFPIQGTQLVTASALFDLVSESFIERFVAMLAAQRAVLYAALSYDGMTKWTPPHALDSAVLAAFNRDQTRDKGFGPALGPVGYLFLTDRLEHAGYRVEVAPSPWRLTAANAPLLAQLLTGIASAVRAEGALDADTVDDWLAFRLQHTATAMIGHQDIVAEPR